MDLKSCSSFGIRVYGFGFLKAYTSVKTGMYLALKYHLRPGETSIKGRLLHVGSCQNYGPFLGTLNNRCRIIIRTQKGTLILTTTHVLSVVLQDGADSGLSRSSFVVKQKH